MDDPMTKSVTQLWHEREEMHGQVVAAVIQYWDRVRECHRRWPEPKQPNWAEDDAWTKSHYFTKRNHHARARGTEIGKAQTRLFRRLTKILGDPACQK
jgi:hypothetical protein